MNLPIYPWQTSAWSALRGLQDQGRLPHAILLHGPPGIGKMALAEHFARALLCQSPLADGQGCGQCASCAWFAGYNHPDYRRVRPEALEAADAQGGDADGAADTEERKAAKSTRAPSREIKVEQIRALTELMALSTHRQGRRVVLLYPAQAMNAIAANALLKTLEEPPADTVFLLIADGLERLLPTILSRCRKFALPTPDTVPALAWLREQGVADAPSWLARAGGSPLAALAQAQTRDEAFPKLLAYLAEPNTLAALKTAELLQKHPPATLVDWMQRWLHDMLSCKMTGVIRYLPGQREAIAALASRADTVQLLHLARATGRRRVIAEHPLSARLFIEDMLLDYANLFPG